MRRPRRPPRASLRKARQVSSEQDQRDSSPYPLQRRGGHRQAGRLIPRGAAGQGHANAPEQKAGKVHEAENLAPAVTVVGQGRVNGGRLPLASRPRAN